MTQLEKLEALPIEVIDSFLQTGKSAAMDQELQIYTRQLTIAAEINNYTDSITRASKELAVRVKAELGIKMTIRLAKERIYDAINYFHMDSAVSQKVWDMRTADKLLDLATLMVADDKLDQAGKYIVKANELRKRANDAISNEDLKAPVFLISDKLSLEELGYDKEDLRKIKSKDSQGFYIKLINALKDVDPDDRKRLLRDADITDTDFEEIENE